MSQLLASELPREIGLRYTRVMAKEVANEMSLDERELLPVSEIATRLLPAWKRLGAESVFFCGPYVREDRNGDLRWGDKLEIVVVADVEGSSMERARYVRLYLSDLLKGANTRPVLVVVSPSEADQLGGIEAMIAERHYDWERVYG